MNVNTSLDLPLHLVLCMSTVFAVATASGSGSPGWPCIIKMIGPRFISGIQPYSPIAPSLDSVFTYCSNPDSNRIQSRFTLNVNAANTSRGTGGLQSGLRL